MKTEEGLEFCSVVFGWLERNPGVRCQFSIGRNAESTHVISAQVVHPTSKKKYEYSVDMDEGCRLATLGEMLVTKLDRFVAK